MMLRNRRSARIIAAAVLCLATAGVLRAADVPDASTIDADTERMPSLTLIPDYPKVARRDRIEGEVQVCFDITRAGRTRRIAVRKSTHRIFEKPAIRAVRASTYEPLPDDAEMSGIKSCRTFRFTLQPVVAETDN
jgi:TonB family protein